MTARGDGIYTTYIPNNPHYHLYLKIKFGAIQSRLPLLNFGILGVIIGGQFFSIGLLGELLISKSLFKSDYTIEKVV